MGFFIAYLFVYITNSCIFANTKQQLNLTIMDIDYFKTHVKSCKSYADTDLNGGYFVSMNGYTAICETEKKSDHSLCINNFGEWEDTGDVIIEVIDFTVETEEGKEVEVLHDDECLELLTEIINRTI